MVHFHVKKRLVERAREEQELMYGPNGPYSAMSGRLSTLTLSVTPVTLAAAAPVIEPVMVVPVALSKLGTMRLAVYVATGLPV